MGISVAYNSRGSSAFSPTWAAGLNGLFSRKEKAMFLRSVVGMFIAAFSITFFCALLWATMEQAGIVACVFATVVAVLHAGLISVFLTGEVIYDYFHR